MGIDLPLKALELLNERISKCKPDFETNTNVTKTIFKVNIDKALSPISGHRWCKTICPLIRGVRFLESWAILVLFSKMYYFYTYIWGSQSKWKT